MRLSGSAGTGRPETLGVLNWAMDTSEAPMGIGDLDQNWASFLKRFKK
jgi:hypothetical protein